MALAHMEAHVYDDFAFLHNDSDNERLESDMMFPPSFLLALMSSSSVIFILYILH